MKTLATPVIGHIPMARGDTVLPKRGGMDGRDRQQADGDCENCNRRSRVGLIRDMFIAESSRINGKPTVR